MSLLVVPEVSEMATMSPGDLEALARQLDRVRRQAEAAIATFIHRAGESGAYLVDKHRTPKAWGRAACNWSGAEAARFVKAGAMLARFESAAVLAADGGLGVAQMHALAAVAANPRVREHLADGETLLVSAAVEMDYDDYVTTLTQWENAADPDGAHESHEQAHRNRKANASIAGNRFFLDAQCGIAAGVQIKEILDAFARTEWTADWETGVGQHGDAMCPGLMDRTDAQRRLDALLAIFLKAAGGLGDATGLGFTINLMVGADAFEHHLRTALGDDVAPLDPNSPGSRCETDAGVPVDPYDMLVAAAIGHVRRVVFDSAGVVIDMGRKQRLFTGALRDAVLMHNRWCIWPGCHRPGAQCQADHVLPWANAGPTTAANGGPACSHHNRWKATGYHTWRDPNGHWHHYRPDHTEIGWRADTWQITELAHTAAPGPTTA